MQGQGLLAGVALFACLMLSGPAHPAASEETQAMLPPPISESLAREIAWRLGIVRIEEIVLLGGLWQIAGRDEDGNERLIDLSARDGHLLH